MSWICHAAMPRARSSLVERLEVGLVEAVEVRCSTRWACPPRAGDRAPPSPRRGCRAGRAAPDRAWPRARRSLRTTCVSPTSSARASSGSDPAPAGRSSVAPMPASRSARDDREEARRGGTPRRRSARPPSCPSRRAARRPRAPLRWSARRVARVAGARAAVRARVIAAQRQLPHDVRRARRLGDGRRAGGARESRSSLRQRGRLRPRRRRRRSSNRCRRRRDRARRDSARIAIVAVEIPGGRQVRQRALAGRVGGLALPRARRAVAVRVDAGRARPGRAPAGSSDRAGRSTRRAGSRRRGRGARAAGSAGAAHRSAGTGEIRRAASGHHRSRRSASPGQRAPAARLTPSPRTPVRCAEAGSRSRSCRRTRRARKTSW